MPLRREDLASNVALATGQPACDKALLTCLMAGSRGLGEEKLKSRFMPGIFGFGHEGARAVFLRLRVVRTGSLDLVPAEVEPDGPVPCGLLRPDGSLQPGDGQALQLAAPQADAYRLLQPFGGQALQVFAVENARMALGVHRRMVTP